MLIGLAALRYLGVSSVRHNTQTLLSTLANSKMNALVKRIESWRQPWQESFSSRTRAAGNSTMKSYGGHVADSVGMSTGEARPNRPASRSKGLGTSGYDPQM